MNHGGVVLPYMPHSPTYVCNALKLGSTSQPEYTLRMQFLLRFLDLERVDLPDRLQPSTPSKYLCCKLLRYVAVTPPLSVFEILCPMGLVSFRVRSRSYFKHGTWLLCKTHLWFRFAFLCLKLPILPWFVICYHQSTIPTITKTLNTKKSSFDVHLQNTPSTVMGHALA